ncbi:penicillin acylase family protein [Nocardioides limicola]|uniref:penicillin acylase family protein n=1 Tax=Nocardioides limicola TaxID=2803368 RepID=UPI00193BE9DF|nr:penicillin acylase family protein [Nocardioides sp. DJM-14]
MLHRLLVATAACPLVIGLLAAPGVGSSPEPSSALSAPSVVAERASAARKSYRATIRRTKHGIPHITAKNYGSLGFGSGYATAETSLCTLMDTVITARGQRSRWFGPDGLYSDEVSMRATNLEVDVLVTDMRNRRAVQKLLADPVAGPSKQVRKIVAGYTAGVNEYLRRHRTKVTDPECKGARYLATRVTRLDLWYGIHLANVLASTGVFVPEIVGASPPSLTDPGLPELPLIADIDVDGLLSGLGRDPDSGFGSNATAVGSRHSATGQGMILGNPHFPWRGRYRFTQQHLTIPGKYDVAGASLIGSPVVNIGWNSDVAWSHTVSTAYRFTPYEYVAVGGTSYLTTEGLKPIQRREVEVTVLRNGKLVKVVKSVHRTEEGYVIDAPALFMPWGLATVWAIRDANAEHLRTLDSFHAMGKATSARDLLRRQDATAGIPWVNTIAADRHGTVLYADHSVVPNVPDEMAASCMTVVGRLLYQLAGLPGLDGSRAGSSCAWRTDADAARPGIFGPRNLPELVTTSWVANANDSYWTPSTAERLEGYARIIGCEQCERTFRTQMVHRYVTDRLARGQKVTPAALRRFQHANRQRLAELARAQGALDQVCRAADGGHACAVLRDWDGRSNTSSRGTHIFAEFADRLPDDAWKVAFDASDPFNTPRGLKTDQPTVQAMRDALASLRGRGIPMNAAWGTLQVAGDRGAPPIGVGGGKHAWGNANAIESREPRRNSSYYRPITYGSSHIQAVAFRGSRVVPRTILTYGQSEDPTSPWSADQTRLFGNAKWVRFPFTGRQIRRAQVSVTRVTAPR